MTKRNSEYMTFPDGWGTSFQIIDRRFKATKPKQKVIHFKESTVGERRFWDAYVNGVEIVKSIHVPIASSVDYGDLFEIQGIQYIVAQKQRKDTRPESWLLSLQSATIAYRCKDEQTDKQCAVDKSNPGCAG